MMEKLIETVKLYNGVFFNVEYHMCRMNKTRHDLYGLENVVNLWSFLQNSDFPAKGLFKSRILYSREIEGIEFVKYKKKKIGRIKIINNDEIEYKYKFNNRNSLDELFKLRGTCDDILIIKDDLVTDTSFCNIIFSGKAGLFTPATPLLRGTKRQKLLDSKTIKEKRIRREDIKKFKEVYLINAMLDIKDIVISIEDIIE